MICGGHTQTLTLTPLPPPKPHDIKVGKESELSLYKSKTWDEYTTSESKPQITLLMVRPNTGKKVNPLYPMTLTSSHTSGVKFMYGLTFGKHLYSEPLLIVETSEFG